MSLRAFLQDHGITQAETASVLGLDPSTLSLKLSWQRPWFSDEVAKVLTFLRARTGEPVTFEQFFADSDITSAVGE